MHIVQTIHIGQLRIGSVNNSSIVQVGTAGLIKASSRLYNTGGFTGPAPELPKTQSPLLSPSVPLPSPTPP